jgi:hypothetical protein
MESTQQISHDSDDAVYGSTPSAGNEHHRLTDDIQPPSTGTAFPGQGGAAPLTFIKELGGAASWITWGLLGSAVTVLSAARPFVRQTAGGMYVHLPTSDAATGLSLLAGVLILGIVLAARHWPGLRLPAAIVSLVISLGLIALYILMTVVGMIGTGYYTDMGAVVHVTWLPGSGMLFSALGSAAIVIASLLALTERSDPQAVKQ